MTGRPKGMAGEAAGLTEECEVWALRPNSDGATD
jgi:hypothetical protein